MRLYSDIDRNLGHCRRYELKDISQKLRNAGFKIIGARYYNILGAWGWLVNGKLLRRKYISPSQTRLFNKFLMFALKLEDCLNTSFGMSILAIAEK
ncbi:MAG: hypothetical protein A2W23_00970 [Planctomycetes bacterium RBG_16_43_13]|nr:MAG: hypothetical protein A2W23_00970 [Planctomycetes bacterium RBG_16_43_13]